MAKQFHTEGYIKEIKVNGKTIAVKIAPSDEFSFSPDDPIPQGCKKLVLADGSGSDAKLIGLDKEFKFSVVSVDLSMLYSLKKDRAKIRAIIKIASSSYVITEIVLI